VRCAKFVTRKQWIATASDDMHAHGLLEQMGLSIQILHFKSSTLQKVGLHKSINFYTQIRVFNYNSLEKAHEFEAP
jgi:hypothetical protein